MPKRVKKQFLDPWTVAKLISGDQGLFWAAGLERHLEQEQQRREMPGWNNVDLGEKHLRSFEHLLGHLLNWEETSIDEIPDPYWEQMEILERMSDIANNSWVIERVLDFSIEISKRIEKLSRRQSKRISHAPVLSDEEYNSVRSINFDVEEFHYNEDQRSDIFSLFEKVERRIRDGDRPKDDDVHALKQISKLRPAGRSKVYAFRYLIIALAELFETENEFGERARITLVTNHADPEYPEDIDDEALTEEQLAAVEPINKPELFASPFKDFVEDYATTIGWDLRSENPSETWSNARQILRNWKAIRNEGIVRRLATNADLQTIAIVISHIMK